MGHSFTELTAQPTVGKVLSASHMGTERKRTLGAQGREWGTASMCGVGETLEDFLEKEMTDPGC